MLHLNYEDYENNTNNIDVGVVILEDSVAEMTVPLPGSEFLVDVKLQNALIDVRFLAVAYSVTDFAIPFPKRVYGGDQRKVFADCANWEMYMHLTNLLHKPPV